MEAWEQDKEFTQEVIEKVTESSDGEHWVIEFESGFGIMASRDNRSVTPSVGDTARLFGKGFGYPVRGILIEGVGILYYRTEEQERARHAQWVEDYNARLKKEFEENKDKLDKDFESLPAPLQKRVSQFREADPDFRWQSEAYEMFCCTESVKILNAVRRMFPDSPQDAEGLIRILPGEDWSIIKGNVPDISDAHSNNTFGGACGLAIALLNNQPV